MLYPRIIPVLLIHKKGLVKTQKFKEPKYVGDPVNAVKIFNEKNVDEIIVIDIDASRYNNEPDYSLIRDIAYECRMPLCYGGGIKSVEMAERILSLGAEKIAISSVATQNPQIVKNLSCRVGNQSVVVVLDVKKKLLSSNYELLINNGFDSTGLDPIKFAKEMQEFGAGEILVNSIDNDGMMQGYDIKIISKIRNSISIPMTVVGGAGTTGHLGEVIRSHGIIGVAAGSLFVFKGKYRAVLINYLSRVEKVALIQESFFKPLGIGHKL